MKNCKIYIEVTNLMAVQFVSGIQRVVREVVLRMLREPEVQIVLLVYQGRGTAFSVLDNEAFAEYFAEGRGSRDKISADKMLDITEFEAGSIFFEIDSVWHSKLKRMELYPLLKGKGVRIAVCYQDIIPVMWPQYVERETTVKFLGYITACITHADLFISSTRANLRYLRELMERVGIHRQVPEAVSWLGMDFRTKDQSHQSENVRESIRRLSEKGRYLLMVGTVEPRKNHRLVLEACDRKLFDKGLQLVIAGRSGWNIRELEQQLRTHPQLDAALHWIEDANDDEIEYLYSHSYMVVFPSFAEGFGLPIVEACARGIPVITSDHPVMREVGGAFCEYVDPTDADALAECVSSYLAEPDRYQSWRDRLAGYQPCSWDAVEQNMIRAIRDELAPAETPERDIELKQMVILSARADDLLRSLPYVEAYMPFIKEVVVCCPDAMKEEMERHYGGVLLLYYLTDSQVLAGETVTEDHGARNIFLRTKAFFNDIIAPVFLMGDDDYRPLKLISKKIFYEDGRYNAHYSHDLLYWRGTQGNPTSFDRAQGRSRDFLSRNGYATYAFDSHMPQAIEKKYFLEMIERHPEMLTQGVMEWNYFNYMLAVHPQLIRLKPYTVMDWPGFLEDWEHWVECPEYLFENFYDVVYQEDTPYGHPGHFRGFSTEISPGQQEENERKEQIYRRLLADHRAVVSDFDQWMRRQGKERSSLPVYALHYKEGTLQLEVPDRMPILAGGFLRLEFAILLRQEEREHVEWQLTWGVYQDGKLLGTLGSARFFADERLLEALLSAPEMPGVYQVEWRLFTEKTQVYRTMELEVKD